MMTAITPRQSSAKKRIAIDCDDVIVPTALLTLRAYNKLYGTKLKLKDFYIDDRSAWDVADDAEAIQRVNDFLRTKEFQHAGPFRQAIGAIRTLNEHYDLHIVTGRSDFLAEATNAMLAQYFPDIFRSVEFTNFFGKKSRTKAEVCQQLGADLLIDDHLHHAQIVAACGIDVLLFGDYPWNQAATLPPHIRRVKDWAAILDLLVPAGARPRS